MLSSKECSTTTVLVTGATGFIGRHLCSHLVQQGYCVRGTYRKSIPVEDYPTSMTWVKIKDIGADTNWKEALDGVNIVVHLAALAHQMGSSGEGRLDEFMRINAFGTRHLAESITASSDVSRLVFMSSIGAVKTLSEKMITDSTECNPDTDYGKSKRVAEKAIQEVLKGQEADWCILRPPLVYGPGNPGNMERLLKLIRMRLPLPFASIKNRRSFIFVGNLLEVIELCISHPDVTQHTLLLSDGEDVSTPELIRKIGSATDTRVFLIPMPFPILRILGKLGDIFEQELGISTGVDSYSIERLVGSLPIDSSKFCEVTGWQPKYSFDQGLKTTLEETLKL